MSLGARTVVLNLLAATEGGQVIRARHFLAALRRYDPDSPYLVLKARGSLPFCAPCVGMAVREVDIGKSGMLRAGRRMLWENRALPRLLNPVDRFVYLTFSHYLPPAFPQQAVSVVGISNLAPFSEEARVEEPRRIGRMKLRALRRTVLSSALRATAVIALSDTCKRVLISNGIDPGKIHVVPNGVCIPSVRQAEGSVCRSLGLGSGFLLYVSHFHRYKNFTRLVQAYALLSPELRASMPLVLVGKPLDAGCYADVRRQVHAAGLEANVHIVPGVEHGEVLQLYASAALFVFPSLIENSPNILLEAMASGLPVIAGCIEPMPEFGGDAASYFNPLDVADIARCIERVATDPLLQVRMRERSLARASRYSWDDFTASVVRICHEAAA